MEEKEIKGRNDYEWHPDLTTTQIDELWAEGIVPGSPEYSMGVKKFGIKYQPEELGDEENQISDETKVDLDINKKTGACKITSKDLEMQIEMNAADYSRKGLKQFRQDLLNVEEIAKEDQKYIKNIDPTIYKAYLNYDSAKKDTEAPSAAKMYVNGVIKKSKALDKGKIDEEVQMPGKINVDIGWHPKMKNAREKTQKFRKIRDFVGNFRANKILKKHGAPGIMAWKKLNVANITDNRKLIRTAIFMVSGIPMLGAAANVGMNSLEESQNSTRQQIEAQGPVKQENTNLDKSIEENNYENESINTNSEKQKNAEFSKEEKNRIYPGDVISAEQYTATFGSADSKQVNGALSTKEMLGVNKIACVIDGKTYSSVNYSEKEIYEMAKKANVEVRYHVDKAIEMDGKICVQVHEKNNPAPTYVYHEDGMMKTMDGKKWTGDTEYSSVAGWMSEKDIQKANVKVQNKTKESGKNHQKVQEKEKER